MDSVYFIRTPLAWRLKGKEYFLEQPCDVALDARGGRGLKGRVVVGFSRHGRLLISRRIRNGALYKLARQPVADIDSFFQPRPVFLFLFSLLSLLCNINRAIPSSFLEFSSLYIYIFLPLYFLIFVKIPSFLFLLIPSGVIVSCLRTRFLPVFCRSVLWFGLKNCFGWNCDWGSKREEARADEWKWKDWKDFFQTTYVSFVIVDIINHCAIKIEILSASSFRSKFK